MTSFFVISFFTLIVFFIINIFKPGFLNKYIKNKSFQKNNTLYLISAVIVSFFGFGLSVPTDTTANLEKSNTLVQGKSVKEKNVENNDIIAEETKAKEIAPATPELEAEDSIIDGIVELLVGEEVEEDVIPQESFVAGESIVEEATKIIPIIEDIIDTPTIDSAMPSLVTEVYDEPAVASSNCHPSYIGACLEMGIGDYDCAGGSGNGPNYTGTVRVIGPDEFGLDRDHDGWGCE